MNHIVILGRLTKDVEEMQTSSGTAVYRTSIACERRASRDKVDFIQVSAFGKTGQFMKDYFYKGKPIMVTGELHVDDYTTQSGEKKTRVDVTVDSVSFVPTEKTENQPVSKDTAIDDDDLPF